MVTGIHFVEAYGLNPVIYSSHLKLHPLLVLTVLVFAEHSVGIWGLLLAGRALHNHILLKNNPRGYLPRGSLWLVGLSITFEL